MKKIISALLAVVILLSLSTALVMAETATATVAMYLQDANYNSNQAVLALTLEGVSAENYTYQWYNSASENGPYVPMYKETNSTYVLSSNDYNTYMRCEITPYTDDVAGEKITSSTYYLGTAKDSMRIGAIKRDQTTIADYKGNPGTYYVEIGGEKIIILDEYSDSFYAITDGFKGWKNFGASDTCQFLPNDTTNIGYYLNNDFLTNTTDTGTSLTATIQQYIPSHDWWVEPGDDTVRTPYTFNAKVSLLSASEYGKYMDRIGWGPHDAGGDWWLRNSRPKNNSKIINVVIVKSNETRLGDTNGGQAGNKEMLVRPTFYLSDEIFLNEKARVDNMGAGIKAMMVERYSNAEDLAKLKTLYTIGELQTIGFEGIEDPGEDPEDPGEDPGEGPENPSENPENPGEDPGEGIATVAMHLQNADYNSNQAVLALTIEGVEADSYTYQWYNSTEENGTYSPMYKETNSTYVLSSNDYNTYIRCEITPYTDDVAGKKITSSTYFLSIAKDSMRIGAIKRDQTTIADYKGNPGTYYVEIGGEKIIILDEYSDSFYAITDGFKGWKNFGASDTCQFLPNDATNIGYYLNNDFLTNTTDTGKSLTTTIQQYIPSHDWWVEPGDDSVRTPYTFNAKVSLLSATEYGKYMDRIGWGPHDAGGDWWLRNSRPKNNGKTINVVIVKSNTSRYGDTNGGQAGNKEMLVRPTFYLSDEIFLNEKARVDNMGAGIKAMMVERYSNAEDLAKLKTLYTIGELQTIGFEGIEEPGEGPEQPGEDPEEPGEGIATVAMYLQDANYNSNQAVLALTLEGVSAENYTYQWYNSASENGPYVPMYKETNSTYVLSSNDYNTYMRCEITPYTDDVAGEKITSSTYYLGTAKDSMRIGAIKRDQTTIADYKGNPGTYYVEIGGEKIIILDEYADSFYAITDGFKGWKNFGDSTTCQFLPNDTSNIGYWLNNEFLTSNQISADIQKYIPSHDWWVEPGDDTVRIPYTFNAKVSLLSATEYGKYMDRIGWGPHDAGGDWWLRNSRPKNNGKTINVVIVKSNETRLGDTNGGQAGNKQMLVRPTFYLSDEIFLNEKARVDNMGAGIKAMMVERYSNVEDLAKLKTLYTIGELQTIGFEGIEGPGEGPEQPGEGPEQPGEGPEDPGEDPEENITVVISNTNRELTVTTNADENVKFRYTWYISDSEDEQGIEVYANTSEKYTISTNDETKYVSVVVTPVYADGSQGQPVASSNKIYVDSFGALQRTDYPAEERRATKQNPKEYLFTAGGEEMILLDAYSDDLDTLYVMTANAKGTHPFDTDNTQKFDIEDLNNIGYWLNNDFLNATQTISEDIQPYINTEHLWWTECGQRDGICPDDYSFTAGIALLSRSEYSKYWGKFGWDHNDSIKTGWWLRTGRNSGPADIFCAVGIQDGNYSNPNANGYGNTWNKAANASYYVRPTFYLTKDFLLNVKITDMGEKAAEAIRKVLTPEEFLQSDAGYTENDLLKLGLIERPKANNVSIQGRASVGAELKGSYLYSGEKTEDGTTYGFEISDDGETFTKISNDSVIKVTEAYNKKYVRFCVTPVNIDGVAGETYYSKAIKVSGTVSVAAESIEVTDSDGNAVFSLMNADKLKVKAKLKNYTSSAKNVWVMLYIYDKDGNMLDNRGVKVTVGANETVDNNKLSIQVPEYADGNYAKLIIWDGLLSMNPAQNTALIIQ